MTVTNADLPSITTPELVTELVHRFYAKVRKDPILGSIFEERLNGKWDVHLSKMVDFWSSLTLLTGTYFGKPHIAHIGLRLTPEHFEHWLELFDETVAECCTGQAANLFRDRAHRIADSLQIGLNIGPNALKLPPHQSERT